MPEKSRKIENTKYTPKGTTNAKDKFKKKFLWRVSQRFKKNIFCIREAAKKKILFLVVRPLRPLTPPPPLCLVVIRNFFIHDHK